MKQGLKSVSNRINNSKISPIDIINE